MAKVLTSAAVERLGPAAGKRRLVRDGGSRSLFLMIHPTGHKSWVMRFRGPGGKPTKLTLGPLDISGRQQSGEPEIGAPLGLVAARQLAAKINAVRAAGRDVVADHRAEKHRRRVAVEEHAANTFAAAARSYVEEHAKKLRSWQETARLLGFDPDDLSPRRGGLAERWGDRDSRSIDAHDIYAAVEEARRLGVPGVAARRNRALESRARKLRAALSSMFTWLVQHRRVEANPMAGVFKLKPARPRERVLTGAEVSRFWAATASVATPFGDALKLLLLTGARLNEIAELRWSEVSEAGDELAVPGTRTKNGLPFVIPLAPVAREIVAETPRVDGCAYVFTTNGLTPISGWSKTKRRLDAAMAGAPHWQIHDLRRTAATGMAEIGVAPHVVEACLNHISGHKASVAGVYNRAIYAAEKRAALERWAQHVGGLVGDQIAEVVPLKPRGARA